MKRSKQQLINSLRAAYIFSLLPGDLRSRIINILDEGSISSLEKNLGEINKLTEAEKLLFLNGFTHELEKFEKTRETVRDRSLATSIFVMTFLLITGFVAGGRVRHTTEGVLYFVNSLMAGGGAHLIFFPVAAGYISSAYGISLRRLFLPRNNILIDLSAAAAVALLLTPLFFMQVNQMPAGNMFLEVFIFAAAVTAGPALEELFFRYLIFLKGGEKYGYIATAIFSSILFALVHLPETAPLFITYVFAGMIFSLLTWFGRSIFPPLMAHSLINAILLAI